MRGGATLIEFAMILPLLLTIVLWCVDFGRVWHSQIVIANAARMGAETGCLQPLRGDRARWEAKIRGAVVEELTPLAGFDERELELDIKTSENGEELAWVSVEVRLPFRMVVDWPGIPPVVTLQEINVIPVTD